MTLAWEDEEQGDVWDLQVKVKVNNFNDMALAWEDEVWEKGSRISRKVKVKFITLDGWKVFDERNWFENLKDKWKWKFNNFGLERWFEMKLVYEWNEFEI